MISRGWPVFDPGSRTLSDLFEYEVEIEYEVTDDDIVTEEAEPFGPEEPTVVMPAACLVERCTTAATWGHT